MQIEVFNLNNYVLPEIKVTTGTKFILNGDNNSFFNYVKERYNGSPTNAGIINAYINYTIGEGLIDKNGENIRKYISKTDLRLICQDYKLQGQFALQVIWSQPIKALEQPAKVLQVKYFPVDKIGLNPDKQGGFDAYWYCYDWNQKTKYKPQLYPKFDGVYKEQAIEIAYFKRPTSDIYFASPDYLSGLQYAQLEEELSNMAINHVINDFSAGKIITVKGGTQPTDELKEVYTRKIQDKLTGSSNKAKAIVSFVTDEEGGEITVDNVEPTQFDEIFTNFTELAERKLFQAHSVTNPILFGVKEGAGFSNKDEMKDALKTLYRSNINPMREVIIDALESILKFAEPNIELKFEDFEELRVQESTQVSPDTTQNNVPE